MIKPALTRSLPALVQGGAVLDTPNAEALDYSSATTLLGINGTYGFQLSLVPDIMVTVTQTQACSPLSLSIDATGTGFPFAGAEVSYCLILVTLGQTSAQYPSYTIQTGTNTTNSQGMTTVSFSSVTNPNQVYSFIAYAHMDGIVGVGYLTQDSATDQSVVPLLEDTGSQEVVLAHSYDLNDSGPAGFTLQYNATFVICKEDFTLGELSLNPSSSSGIVGSITSGVGNPYVPITMPACTTGILIVTYQENSSAGGIMMMPWGISALAFPVTFGGNPQQQEWVITDLRQVMIDNVSYQAKLSMWSYQETQVTG